jgi:hypothetical protein
MPIAAYAVALGTFDHFTRDSSQQGRYGKYYHGHIYLQSPAGVIECAVDVSTPEGMPVDFLRRDLVAKKLKPLTALADGIHPLTSDDSSGALDYVRAKFLDASDDKAWKRSRADDTLDKLEAMLTKSRRVLVFGSPYTVGLGIHDVHMNQGDPEGSQWYAANGIWQDGGVIVVTKPGARAFLTKFTNQTFDTDDHGNPLP